MDKSSQFPNKKHIKKSIKLIRRGKLQKAIRILNNLKIYLDLLEKFPGRVIIVKSNQQHNAEDTSTTKLELDQERAELDEKWETLNQKEQGLEQKEKELEEIRQAMING